MDLETLRNNLLTYDKVSEETPWGNENLVYKYFGKVFAIIGIDEVPIRMNLKCDPDKAIELRENYESIIPGFHMNKKHWNTVILDNTIPNDVINNMIDHSYKLIQNKIPKKLINSINK